ncbi:enoyl-CoA hydratase/isomerase family protein [Aquisediminimonas sediminicola]|uniref:enoyl-CoA hydratase/isomerase family protein n=1 Tax=Alteraquisediminimonas sediminicola TaxID=2676787 RepID=UPI001C8DF05C|nr:enoyl-CoA hydratase-related protein [Aquisediminimonas sediminicola]
MTDAFAYRHLIVIREGALLRVTLNRPEIYNALNDDLVDELLDLFGKLYWQHDIRVVLLGGNGKHFCAGLDMSERSGGIPGTGEALKAQRKISEIVISMRRCPQPIVAMINGAASGGGFAIALASDVRIATPDLRMNAAFIRVGLSACDIGVSYFLPRMVGASVASEYMLTGRFFTADKALGLGLISSIETADTMLACAEKMVADMLHATPLGLRLTKEALNYAIDANGLEAVVAMEDRNQILCAQSEDFAEGIAAFMEKRTPRYADVDTLSSTCKKD